MIQAYILVFSFIFIVIQAYILVFSFIFIVLYCIDEPKFIYNVTCSQFNFNHT